MGGYVLATGEWTMTNKNLNYKEYAKLAEVSILQIRLPEWVSAISWKYNSITMAFLCSTHAFPITILWIFRILKEQRSATRPFERYIRIDWYREDAWGRTGRMETEKAGAI